MKYIYPITDPKILKLGIRWALYREDAPERTDFWVNKNMNDVYYDAQGYLDAEKKHLESFIAYLKEPKFKVGDIIDCYFPNNQLAKRDAKIVKMLPNSIIRVIIEGQLPSEWNQWEIKYSTHHHPGQEVESFKYLKEDYLIISERSKLTNTDLAIKGHHKIWQEVEEPVKVKGNIGMKKPNPDYTQFQADKKSAKILAEI